MLIVFGGTKPEMVVAPALTGRLMSQVCADAGRTLTANTHKTNTEIHARMQTPPVVYDAVTTELHQLLSRKRVEQDGFEEPLIRQRLDKVVKARIGDGKIFKVSIRAMERMELK